jgi:hypothetical protein
VCEYFARNLLSSSPVKRQTNIQRFRCYIPDSVNEELRHGRQRRLSAPASLLRMGVLSRTTFLRNAFPWGGIGRPTVGEFLRINFWENDSGFCPPVSHQPQLTFRSPQHVAHGTTSYREGARNNNNLPRVVDTVSPACEVLPPVPGRTPMWPNGSCLLLGLAWRLEFSQSTTPAVDLFEMLSLNWHRGA